MRTAFCLVLLCALSPARAANPAPWEIRDVNHPKLGPIIVAVPTRAVTTPVQKDRIVSLVFFSCEKAARKIAIELANASEADTTGGLRPREMPRLICNVPQPSGPAVKSNVPVTWELSEIGDALARGISPALLRRCASLDVVQNLVLPKGWAQETQRIDVELLTHGIDLDPVFYACGETVAAKPGPAPAPAPAVALPPPADAWKRARTIAKGRTNVRAGPSLDAAVVVELPPNVFVLVQPTSTQWWKVKPTRGEGFSGYIRQDRLAFD